MKPISYLASVGVFTLLLASGCIDFEDDTTREMEYEPVYTGMNDIVNSSNELAMDMYGNLAEEGENVFFSPYSIMIALGMVYEGARGRTAEEILSVIDLPSDNTTRRNMIRSLQSQLNPQGADYELSTANAYWLNEGRSLNGEYRDVIEDDYLAWGQKLDFAGDPSGSADAINGWVDDETGGRIKDLIPPGIIDVYTYLILTNAIYFKASWKWQFDEGATEVQPFYRSDGTECQADLMHMCDEDITMNYARNDDVQMLQLPYMDEELSMYVVLPWSNDIGSLESRLSGEYIGGLKEDLHGEWVDLYLPRFRLEKKYRLNEELKELGMVEAFDPVNADLSGIDESGESILYIDEVLHQSFVEVNEEGTEAAAATAVEIALKEGGGGNEPTPTVFRADHPFIFFIEHQATGQILFMGKVEDPSV